MRVGFVGIGNMGRPMAANLAQGGHELIVADLSREAVESFTGEFDNARPANGLAALAQDSDAVITIVPNGKDVRKIALGADGGDNLADGMAEGSLLIDMSSSAPTGTVTSTTGTLDFTANGVPFSNAWRCPRATSRTSATLIPPQRNRGNFPVPIFRKIAPTFMPLSPGPMIVAGLTAIISREGSLPNQASSAAFFDWG